MPANATDVLMQAALAHFRSGQRPEATSLCRQILVQNPRDHKALQLLGALAVLDNDHNRAIDLMQQALALEPNVADYHSNLGGAYLQKGDFENAISCYRRALELQPDHAQAQTNLGRSLELLLQAASEHHREGRLQKAEALYRQILALRPTSDAAHFLLGTLVAASGRPVEAIESLRQAIALQPRVAVFHQRLGSCLRSIGLRAESIASFRNALALEPDDAGLLTDFAEALLENGDGNAAIDACRRALAINPQHAQAHHVSGNALSHANQTVEAVAHFERAARLDSAFATDPPPKRRRLQDHSPDIAIDLIRRATALQPTSAFAHTHLGIALQAKGRLDEAIRCYLRALALDPVSADAHWNLGSAYLLTGNFPQGWAEFEWRWQHPKFPSARRNFTQPMWDGRPLPGQTLLLHAEQGFGDTIQFIRYVEQVRPRAERVIVECQPALLRLLRSSIPSCEWIGAGDPLPVFDVHCPLLSLPLVFGTTLATVPGKRPYLHADAATLSRWQSRLHNDTLNVGLVWAGSKNHVRDRERSMSLTLLTPLSERKDIRFISLQKGEAAAPVSESSFPLTDWTNELTDFAHTAALIACLDLVITVDTSVAHLAGALSKPVWTLLPFVPDWRWLRERDDSPWYPTMRLFRQPDLDDWASVVEDVGEALRAFVQGPKRF